MAEATQRGGKYSRNVQIVVDGTAIDMLRSPSLFMDLVAILVDNNEQKIITPNNYEPYDIGDKIDFNEIIKHRQRIESFYIYFQMIEKAYDTLNESSPSARETALKKINSKYQDCIGDIFIANKPLLRACQNPGDKAILQINLIRDESDSIIDCIINDITEKCKKSLSCLSYSIEDIELHAALIVYHAVVECKVLEKPL